MDAETLIREIEASIARYREANPHNAYFTLNNQRNVKQQNVLGFKQQTTFGIKQQNTFDVKQHNVLDVEQQNVLDVEQQNVLVYFDSGDESLKHFFNIFIKPKIQGFNLFFIKYSHKDKSTTYTPDIYYFNGIVFKYFIIIKLTTSERYILVKEKLIQGFLNNRIGGAKCILFAMYNSADTNQPVWPTKDILFELRLEWDDTEYKFIKTDDEFVQFTFDNTNNIGYDDVRNKKSMGVVDNFFNKPTSDDLYNQYFKKKKPKSYFY